MSLLVGKRLSRSFGGFKAIDSVDLEVRSGERRALIGPNGAGKTTLFNLLTGYLRPEQGTVLLDGREITGLPPHAIARLGVSRAFQVTNIFPRLSVLQNVQVALLAASRATSRPWGAGWVREQTRAAALLEEVGLADRMDQQAGTLSHGDQRALELALALALNPRLLILDEPTAGMAPAETMRAMKLIASVADRRGMTLLFSEHDMEAVFGTADRITVLHQGKVLADGTPGEVRTNQRVREVYLGEQSC